MLPWLTAEHEETQAVMGQDFWSYGLAENLDILDTQIRWSYEQGLIPRVYKTGELFATVESLRFDRK